jgi:regulator of cell morphogenesis and NO signaling
VPSSTTIAELVVEVPARARVFERLGLDYCCGGKRTLADACRERGLDPAAVAAELDSIALGPDASDWTRRTVAELVDHIVDRHHAYLRRELPRLSELVARSERAHGADHPELAEIRATFERLRSELEHHLADEESSLFPACRQSADRATFVATPELLEHLEHEHAAAGTMLERLSQLTDGYDTSRAACNTHRAAIDGLRELELDMHEHVHEENNILFPRVLAALAA